MLHYPLIKISGPTYFEIGRDYGRQAKELPEKPCTVFWEETQVLSPEKSRKKPSPSTAP